MEDILEVGLAAEAEVVSRFGRSDSRANIRYVNGTHRFSSLAEFQARQDEVELDRVDKVWLYVGLDDGSEKAVINVDFGGDGQTRETFGANVYVRSDDKVWARGMADVLTEQVGKGEVPYLEGTWKSPRWWRVIFIAFVLWFVGLFAYVVYVDGDFNPYVFFGSLALCVFAVPGLDGVMREVRPRNANFKLRRPDEQPAPTRRPGLSIRLQDAIRKRPFLSVFLTFWFSFGVNELSERI